MTILLFLHGSLQLPPPSASRPWRLRPDGAALGSCKRPCRRGRPADLCRGHGGCGRPRRLWPRKGFRVVFWGGSDEVTGGVCTLAGDFHSLLWDVEWCLLLKDPYLLSWDGLLEIRV